VLRDGLLFKDFYLFGFFLWLFLRRGTVAA
jgi:hypothetical protein